MECGALFDALRVMDLVDEQTHREGKEFLASRLDALEDVLSGYEDVHEYVHVYEDVHEHVYVSPASPGFKNTA